MQKCPICGEETVMVIQKGMLCDVCIKKKAGKKKGGGGNGKDFGSYP